MRNRWEGPFVHLPTAHKPAARTRDVSLPRQPVILRLFTAIGWVWHPELLGRHSVALVLGGTSPSVKHLRNTIRANQFITTQVSSALEVK